MGLDMKKFDEKDLFDITNREKVDVCLKQINDLMAANPNQTLFYYLYHSVKG